MRYALLVLALVILALLVIDFNARTTELNRLVAEHEVVNRQLESKEATQSALEQKIAYATSEAAVMEWAYQNHLARPGDQPVIPFQVAQATPVVTPQPTVQPTQVSNLTKWWILFFAPSPGSTR